MTDVTTSSHRPFSVQDYGDLLTMERTSRNAAEAAAELAQADPSSFEKKELARMAQQIWHAARFERLSYET